MLQTSQKSRFRRQRNYLAQNYFAQPMFSLDTVRYSAGP